MDIDPHLLVLVKSNAIGDAEPDLGARLLESFLRMVAESDRAPRRMIFMNAGVFATTEGSPHLAALERLAEVGTEIRSCVTCLEYYGRRDKLRVGAAGTMRETAAAIHEAGKVVTL